MYLSTNELAVLRSLNDGAWRVPTEIHEQIGVHTQHVREACRVLTAHGLLERGNHWTTGGGAAGRWGEFHITDLGRQELAEHNQLRLVEVEDLDSATGEGRR